MLNDDLTTLNMLVSNLNNDYWIKLKRVKQAKGPDKYSAIFIDKNGRFYTDMLKLKSCQDDINHYISSLGYKFRVRFFAGKSSLDIKYDL